MVTPLPKTAAKGLDYLKGIVDKPISEAEAKTIIAEFGTPGFDNGNPKSAVDNYGDAVASAITGLSKEQAHNFLEGLVNVLDFYDTSANNNDHILTGKTSDIYKNAFLGKTASEVKTILNEATNPYKVPPSTPEALQKLLDTGKTNTAPLDFKKSLDIINNLGISFGSTADEFASALIGLTRTEAFMFLKDVITRLDQADGGSDKNDDLKIDFTRLTGDQILVATGLAPDQDDDRLEASLNLISDVFRDSKNPTDKQYRDYLKNPNPPKSGTVYNTLMKHQKEFETVATINLSYYLPQYTQPVPYQVNGNTGVPNQNSTNFLNTAIQQITAGIQKKMTGGFTNINEEGIYLQNIIGYMAEGKYQTGTIPDMTGVPTYPNPDSNPFRPGTEQHKMYQDVLDTSKKQGVNGIQFVDLRAPYWGLGSNVYGGQSSQQSGYPQQSYTQTPYTVNGTPNQMSTGINAYANNLGQNSQYTAGNAVSLTQAQNAAAQTMSNTNRQGGIDMMRTIFGVS